ncbi:MAG: protein kinase [Gemmatimonadales bacterium]
MTNTKDQAELDALKAALQHRYEIKSELGRGGMATVYLAEETRHSRHLAVKVLRADLTQTIGADRFLREIRTIAGLTHPNILPLFDSGDANGRLFYVMPFVDGESLRDLIKRQGQLTVEQTLQIAGEVADALGFAHDRGIIHRDIKPENILIEAGHAVVTDFGIARAVSVAAGEQLTEIGFTLGTPAYMSPEQATADPALDGKSDQYSLATVVFEMLTGKPPLSGVNSTALLATKLLENAPRVRSLRPDVSDAIDTAVARGLDKFSSNRFDTIRQFSDALRIPSQGSSFATSTHRASNVAGRDLTVLPIEIRPLDEELDIYGLTHPGKVERINSDHFLMCSIRREMRYHQTSLTDSSAIPRKGERNAFIAIVANGVGRGEWAEHASRHAMESVTQQLMHDIRTYTKTNDADETAFLNSLHALGVQCQMSVKQKTWDNPDARGAAFGMTMWIGMWPAGYVVQIGSGHIFRWFDGKLSRASTDAHGNVERSDHQHLSHFVPASVVSPNPVPGIHLPVIHVEQQQWGAVGMMCSPGLTKHVPDELIAERLQNATSAKQACEQLLADALENGGTQNISVIVGRSEAHAPATPPGR